MTKSNSVPAWLDSLPAESMPQPPVQSREQFLPLDKLSWQNFERLVWRIIRKESNILDCSLYGEPGQAQGGIDILAFYKAQKEYRVCYQCKKEKEHTPSDIKSAVDKFLDGEWADSADKFVLCAAISLEKTQLQEELNTQRKRLDEKQITFSVWDKAALCEYLKSFPDLVDDFFGRPMGRVIQWKGGSRKLRKSPEHRRVKKTPKSSVKTLFHNFCTT